MSVEEVTEGEVLGFPYDLKDPGLMLVVIVVGIVLMFIWMLIQAGSARLYRAVRLAAPDYLPRGASGDSGFMEEIN